MMNEKSEYQNGVANHNHNYSTELEQRNRLPTLMEVLGRRTLAPVDLFSFYIYMRDQQRSVDYLDFWLDVSQHMSLCRHYVRELRRSMLIDTPDLDKATSKRSSRLLENFNLNDETSDPSTPGYNEKLSQEQKVSQILRDGRPDSRGRDLHDVNTTTNGNGYANTTGTDVDRNGLIIHSVGNTTTIVGPTTTTMTTTVMHPHHGAITTTRTGYSPDVGSDGYSPANSMTASHTSRRPIHYDGMSPLPIAQNTAHDATTLSRQNLNEFAHHTEDRPIDPATGLPIASASGLAGVKKSQDSPYSNGRSRFREGDLGASGLDNGRSIDNLSEKPPRPSFMNTSMQDSSSPGHTVARPDLRASAEKILYTFILPGSEREIVLPHAMIERMIHAIEDEGRDDPEVFDDAKDYVFQAMERDAFPGFLQAKALGNLVPLGVLLRLILGLLFLFAGLWAAFFCILRHKSRATRCWVILPFVISIYLLITYQYKLDIIMAYAGYSEYTWMNWSKVREPYVKKLLMKRAMMALLLFLAFTVALCILFIFVPSTYF